MRLEQLAISHSSELGGEAAALLSARLEVCQTGRDGALGDASPSFRAISTFCYMRYPFARRSPAAWLGRDRVCIALTLKGEDGGESALRVDGLALLEP